MWRGKLGHEGLAERHDLAVGLALWIEVRYAAAIRRGLGVLESARSHEGEPG